MGWVVSKSPHSNSAFITTMKVLQLGKYFPPEPGGIEYFMKDLSDELSQFVSLDVLCSNSSRAKVVDTYDNYTVHRAASWGKVASTSISPEMILSLRKNRKRYDLIHAHHPDPMANLALYLARPECPLIVHWHSDIVRQKHLLKIYRPLLLWMLKRANKIIATSNNYIKGSPFLSTFRDKVVVIPLGLNPARFVQNETLAAAIKNRHDRKRIIFSLGRLAYYKGFEYLIDAARYLPENYVTLIGGTGGLESSLAALIKEKGLSRKVMLVGNIGEKDLAAYYKACDVFVLPSVERSEAFGLVQVEAMYYGKPLVSTDIPDSGVSWVNRHGETGLIVEPRNSGALASAIKDIVDNAERYRLFSANCRRRFESQFSISQVAKQVFDLYTNCYS